MVPGCSLKTKPNLNSNSTKSSCHHDAAKCVCVCVWWGTNSFVKVIKEGWGYGLIGIAKHSCQINAKSIMG